jgi:hypothetical protein
MKYFSILEQASKEAIRVFAEKKNLLEYMTEDYMHPQEDYLLTSENPPVFVVSDGVTLNFKKLTESGIKYPEPSPAGHIAKIFCESLITTAQNKYSELSKEDLVVIFKEANDAVAKYNNQIGKSDISGNPTGFYSATGAFVILRNNQAYWSSICDSFVAHFDKNMNLKFMSTGVCTPYAVINGEERMSEYLEKGVLDLESGDKVFVFTDGFEQYVKNTDFQKLFLEWDENLQSKISKFSKEMNDSDPEKYGHERSLIAILWE